MKTPKAKSADLRSKPTRRPKASVSERINDVLIFELEIERDEDLTLTARLDSFPGYDDEWTASYLTALFEAEFGIELADEELPRAKTVQDVHNIVHRYLK